MPKKVAIINAGQWGSLRQSKGDYDGWAESLKEMVERVKTGVGVEEVPAAEVKVFYNVPSAMEWLLREGVIIFITRGMVVEAKRIAQACPHVRVILLSGLLPEDEVVFLNKGWIDSNMIRNIVLG